MASVDYGTMRSINELASIFSCQWANGMLPQIRFAPLPPGARPYRPDAEDWGVDMDVSGATAMPTSGITQPPITGLCVYEVFRRIGPAARLSYHDLFVRMADALQAYHAWLFRERDPHHEHLVACIHPWETGTDNSPAFAFLLGTTNAYLDTAEAFLQPLEYRRADITYVKTSHRPTERDYRVYLGLLSLFRYHQYNCRAIIEATPFLLQDVLFNSIFCASIRALAQLQEELARSGDVSEAQTSLRRQSASNRAKADQVASAIRGKLWDAESGYFYGYDLKGGRRLEVPTVSSFMPLLGDIANAEQGDLLIAHLTEDTGFGAYLPVASTWPGHPHFDPNRYWSGPVWPVTNWLIWRGLRERQSPLAATIRSSTLKTIAEGVPYEEAARVAVCVMEANSVGHDGIEYTTPSTKQYRHAWLWDSALTAISWPLVGEKPPAHPLDGSKPGFWEYYHPRTGAPLGAPYMTWTASLFLDMLAADV
jgi:hypothetical protein